MSFAYGSLRRLKVDTIDLLYPHRVDPSVPIEDVYSPLRRWSIARARGWASPFAAPLRRGEPWSTAPRGLAPPAPVV